MRTLAPVPIVRGRARAFRFMARFAFALSLVATWIAAAPAPKPKPAAARPKETLSGFYRKASPTKRDAKPAAPARPGLFAARSGSTKTAPRPAVTAAYRDAVKRWHEATTTPAPRNASGEPCLALANLNSHERSVLCPREDGTFDADAREAAAYLFREPGSENAHPVHPRLLTLLLTIQEHFHAGEVRLLSGYRSPWEGNSNHGKGRAADFVIPGASDDTVASFARTLGFAGVGIYPTSHFVHLDVRDASYFWVDASAPGRPHRERGVLANVAKESDERAKTRGELRVFGPLVKHDARTWLAARGSSAPASSATEGEAASLDEGRSTGPEASEVQTGEDADLDATDESKAGD
jgi:uncharacterized protein YcbK (DUF882 family)